MRTALEKIYVHSFGELVGWLGAPFIVVPVIGAVAGWTLQSRTFWRTIVGLVGAMVLGAATGALGGAWVAEDASALWAGGLMGTGAAALMVITVAVVRARKGIQREGEQSAISRAPSQGEHASLRVGLTILLAGHLAGCVDTRPAPSDPRSAPAPDPANVEAVVFLVGDPGATRFEHSPVLVRLRDDVEAWAERTPSGTPMAMVVLGDIIYPDGLAPPESAGRQADSLLVASQIEVVAGPAATDAGVLGIFVPGNHDWGLEESWEGATRIVELDEFLHAWSGPGRGRLDVQPTPGTGGPALVKLGPALRLVLLDTAWWLLGADPSAKRALVDSLRTALDHPEGGRTILAAHHPLESGGPHGVAVELGETFGIRFLLKKAGLLLQDLESRPYTDLKAQLTNVFSEGARPDIFAGGHEHSLQVFSGDPGETVRSLVVGSGSKLTEVADAPGMLFGRSEPGYGVVFVRSDGTMHIRLEATTERFLDCSQNDADEVEGCVRQGIEAFRTVWAENVGTPRHD